MSRLRVAHGLLVALTLAVGSARLLSQSPTLLTSLTVPDSELSTGCRLRPFVPPQKKASVTGAVTTPASAFPYPSNPWSGTDGRLLIETRRRIDISPTGAGATDPTPADDKAMRAQSIEHVVEAYHAMYDGPNGSVDVAAIRFDDPSLATSKRSVQSLLNGSPRANQIVKGAVVVQINGNSTTDCYRAIDTYVRRVK